MKKSFDDIEELLIGYFSGELNAGERKTVEDWRMESPDNEKYFQELRNGWDALPLLQEMEKFNSFEAIKKVNQQIDKHSRGKWLVYLQKIAAVLIIPLILYSGYITVRDFSTHKRGETFTMQTVSARPGTVSQFALPDGTKVWLNSGSSLQFPVRFSGPQREVKLSGEAFFEVTKNADHPFVLNAHDLNVKVLGTSFNVVSYDDEPVSEVVLVSGKVNLSTGTDKTEHLLGTMNPGQKSVYTKGTRRAGFEDVDVEKYISWRNGSLIFRNDTMSEVIKRLSRWFNVEITVVHPEINDYIYTATFRKENLSQVLTLLKISAPIDYRIEDRKALPNGEFTKQKIYLMKK